MKNAARQHRPQCGRRYDQEPDNRDHVEHEQRPFMPEFVGEIAAGNEYSADRIIEPASMPMRRSPSCWRQLLQIERQERSAMCSPMRRAPHRSIPHAPAQAEEFHRRASAMALGLKDAVPPELCRPPATQANAPVGRQAVSFQRPGSLVGMARAPSVRSRAGSHAEALSTQRRTAPPRRARHASTKDDDRNHAVVVDRRVPAASVPFPRSRSTPFAHRSCPRPATYGLSFRGNADDRCMESYVEHANISVTMWTSHRFFTTALPDFRVRTTAGRGQGWVTRNDTTYIAINRCPIRQGDSGRQSRIQHVGFVVADGCVACPDAAPVTRGFVPAPHPHRKRVYFIDTMSWSTSCSYYSDDVAQRDDYPLTGTLTADRCPLPPPARKWFDSRAG